MQLWSLLHKRFIGEELHQHSGIRAAPCLECSFICLQLPVAIGRFPRAQFLQAVCKKVSLIHDQVLQAHCIAML